MTRQFVLVCFSFFFTLLSGVSAQAQQTTNDTDFRLYPVRPVFCEKKNYPLVSRAYEIEKVSETASTASFKFLMHYGRCETNRFFTKVISQSEFTVQIRSDKKASRDVKEAIQYTFTFPAEDEIEVIVNIDKTKMFSASTRQHYTLYFRPTASESDFAIYRTDGRIERDPRYSMHFPWHVYVSQTPNQGLELAITQ